MSALDLIPENEITDCCGGTGVDIVRDESCSVCFRCDYCGHVSATPLTGRDEDGDPVHPACAPGGAFRLEVEQVMDIAAAEYRS